MASVFSPTDRLDKASNTFCHDLTSVSFLLSNHSVNISLQASLLFLASYWMAFKSFGLTPSCRPISNHLVAMLGITSSVSWFISNGTAEPTVMHSNYIENVYHKSRNCKLLQVWRLLISQVKNFCPPLFLTLTNRFSFGDTDSLDTAAFCLLWDDIMILVNL